MHTPTDKACIDEQCVQNSAEMLNFQELPYVCYESNIILNPKNIFPGYIGIRRIFLMK